MAKVRLPSQAGTFYAGAADSLRTQIEECFLNELGPQETPHVLEKGPRRVLGLLCPHAGYIFSGPVAAHAYGRLAHDGKPEHFVLFGPNHTGHGSGLAAMIEGSWRTPLGDVKIDHQIARQIVQESSMIDVDDSAHQYEHSIEVQLPFLQYLYGSDFQIVPISFLMQDLSSCREVGEAVATVLEGKNAVVLASSDLTHYAPQAIAQKNDRALITAIEAMDEAELYSVIASHHVTACGYGPIAALITAAKALQATNAELLCYKTSGDVSGDYSSVVGYASLCFNLL